MVMARNSASIAGRVLVLGVSLWLALQAAALAHSGDSPAGPALGTIHYSPLVFRATAPSGYAGRLEYGDIALDVWPPGATRHWRFTGAAGDVITIQAIPARGADLVLTLVNPAGATLIAARNSAGDGQPERIEALPLAADGDYQIVAGEATGQASAYAVSVGDDGDWYRYVFAGTIGDGAAVEQSLPANTDHYWFFSGSAGQSLSLSLTPLDHSDPFFSLIGPDMVTLFDFFDENGSGQAEYLVDYELPTTGFYAILVGEGFFNSCHYQLRVELP
jgi:hypothetical protein